jgi:hypothetical protein
MVAARACIPDPENTAGTASVFRAAFPFSILRRHRLSGFVSKLDASLRRRLRIGYSLNCAMQSPDLFKRLTRSKSSPAHLAITDK